MNDTGTVDCYADGGAESSRDYTLITIYTTLMCITIGGNLLVITAFATDAALRAIANYWIVSLSLTDIFVSTTAMPLQVCAQGSAHVRTHSTRTAMATVPPQSVDARRGCV
jgi:hypothetical protein